MESKEGLAERVKLILASRNLTLYQVSQKTTTLYGRSTPSFLPHNFYHDLSRASFSPSLHQLFALSRISNYRLDDWLSVFGFHLEDIGRLQASLPAKRTMILDSSLGDPESWVPWFRNKLGNPAAPPIAPLGQLLAFLPSRRLRSVLQTRKSNFLYAKIGREDVFGFPDLMPGSIVRANARLVKTNLPTVNGKAPRCWFLVEHAGGLCCCRLQAVGNNRVMPVSAQLPHAQVELQLHEEVRVLGVLDLEIRSLLKPAQPDAPKESAKHRRLMRLPPEEKRLSHLLRNGRSRMGLSFREASAMSRQVASELGDEQYFAAPGSLSDYEALDSPPRHVHKVITLCALYGLGFWTFLKSIGLRMEEAGKESIPDQLVPRKLPKGSRGESRETDEPVGNGFFEQLLNRLEHVPFFLRESLSDLSGLTIPSLHDFFWVGGEQHALHPLLLDGLLIIVNRHRKKPAHFRSKPLWQQPLYILLKRDGTYMCACCGLENGALVIHPYSSDYQRPELLRNHYDAEVVGQIVTVARGL